jgi:hypothetical protein
MVEEAQAVEKHIEDPSAAFDVRFVSVEEDIGASS